jgi:hypothetical protein
LLVILFFVHALNNPKQPMVDDLCWRRFFLIGHTFYSDRTSRARYWKRSIHERAFICARRAQQANEIVPRMKESELMHGTKHRIEQKLSTIENLSSDRLLLIKSPGARTD